MYLPKPMYQPVAYSQVTAISAAIGAGDTTITVDDGALLGDAPNIAVIGTSASVSETIVYGAKYGNILSNVQRGVQGLAKSWSVGETIARNFTALDQSNIQDNINALNDGKVEKTGDTMTGALTINTDNNPLFASNRSDSKFDIYNLPDLVAFRKFSDSVNESRTELYIMPPTNGAMADNALIINYFNGITGFLYPVWDAYNLPVDSGDWKPFLYGNTVAGNNTYNIQEGHYIKLGKLMYVWGFLSMIAKDSAMSGSVSMNLPSPGSSNWSPVYFTYNQPIGFSGFQQAYNINIGYFNSSNVFQLLDSANLPANSHFMFGCAYIV